MYTRIGNILISWQEVIIVIVAIIAILVLTDIFLGMRYKKIHLSFISEEWDDKLSKRAERLRLLAGFRSISPLNAQPCLKHNNLCIIIASIAYTEGDEQKFLHFMNRIKREKHFEIKPFILMLYYLSKGESAKADGEYAKFRQCSRHSANLACIADHVFADKPQEEKAVENAINGFKNPVLKKLSSEAVSKKNAFGSNSSMLTE